MKILPIGILGCLITTCGFAQPNLNFAITNLGYSNATVNLAFPSRLSWTYALQYKTSLTDSSWTTLQTFLANRGVTFLKIAPSFQQAGFYRVACLTSKALVVEGDSLFSFIYPSLPETYLGWPYKFSAPDLLVTNLAQGGKLMAGIAAEYDRTVHTYAPALYGLPAIFVLEGGHNDINNSNSTGEETFALVTNITHKARVDGFYPIVVTTLMPTTPITGDTNKEAQRLQYNSLLRAGDPSYDIVFDLDAMLPAQTNNAYYRWTEFNDGVHLSAAAQADIGAYFKGLLGFDNLPPLTNALVASLEFDTSNATLDSADAKNAWRTNQGPVSSVGGKINTAAYFNGSNDVAIQPVDFNLGRGSGYTVCYWANAANVAATAEWVGMFAGSDPGQSVFTTLSQTNDGSQGGGTALLAFGAHGSANPPSGAVIFGTSNNVADPYANAYHLTNNAWYFVSLSYATNTGLMSFSINGLLPTVGAVSGPPPESSLWLTVGAGENVSGNPADFFTGAIDDVMVWNRPLTPYEIWQLYNDGLGRQLP